MQNACFFLNSKGQRKSMSSPKKGFHMNNLLIKISRVFFCFGENRPRKTPRRFRPSQAASTDPTGSVETPRGARSRGAGAEGENRAKGQGSQGQKGFRCFFAWVLIYLLNLMYFFIKPGGFIYMDSISIHIWSLNMATC